MKIERQIPMLDRDYSVVLDPNSVPRTVEHDEAKAAQQDRLDRAIAGATNQIGDFLVQLSDDVFALLSDFKGRHMCIDLKLGEDGRLYQTAAIWAGCPALMLLELLSGGLSDKKQPEPVPQHLPNRNQYLN